MIEERAPYRICALLKPIERRECVQCGENRPLSRFRGGRRKCMQCQAADCKAWHQKRRDGVVV